MEKMLDRYLGQIHIPLIETVDEAEDFLESMPRKVNQNKEGKNNIPFRLLGILDGAQLILNDFQFNQGMKYFESLQQYSKIKSVLQKITEAKSLGDIFQKIQSYHQEVKKHLDDINQYIAKHGLPHPDLFDSMVLKSYASSRKNIMTGINQLKKAGLKDKARQEAYTALVDSINAILKNIREYYFSSIASRKTKEELRNPDLVQALRKKYNLTVKHFKLVAIKP